MRQLFLLLNFTLCVTFVAAQDGGRMLSFDEALSKMMGNNPQIKAHGYEEKVAEQERKAAFGLRLPQVTAMGSYVYMGDDISIDLNHMKKPVSDIIGGMGGVLPDHTMGQAAALLRNNWELMIQEQQVGFAGGSAVMPLYMGGKINAANNAAKINERSVAEQGEQSKNSLVSELVERYYGLSLACQVVSVRSQVLEGMKEHLADAKALEANGVIAKGERLYAEVKVAEAERELLNARLQIKTLTAALNNTLGESDPQLYTPVTTMFILTDIENLEHFKALALKNSPLLNQVALKRDLAQQGVKAERSEFLPQVALMGGGIAYNYQLSEHVPKWSVGAGVKIKIFDGLSREHKYSAAKNRVRQVESIQVKANNDILVMVEKLYNQICTYGDQIRSIDASMEFAQEYLRIKQAAFKEGMAPSSEVIDAQLNLAKTRTERLQAAYYYDLMLANMLEVAGVSDEFAAYAKRDQAKQIKI